MEFNKNNIPLHTDNKKEHNNVSFERNKKDKEQEKLKEERIRYEKETQIRGYRAGSGIGGKYDYAKCVRF